MVAPNVVKFYSEEMWTRKFWAWGSEYTIVPNRHIGLDIATGRRAIDVPALLSGRVVRVRNTHAMGMVVVIQTGSDCLAYCHLSKHDLPFVGQSIPQGGRVGRLAAGPASLDSEHVEYPGKAWGGVHLHLVHTNHPDAAYTYPRVRGSEFYDPAVLIRSVLSAPAAPTGSTKPVNLNRRKIMYVLGKPGGHYFMVGYETIKHLSTKEDVSAAEKVFGPRIDCNDRQFRVALIGLRVPYSQAKPGADWTPKTPE